MPKKQEDKIVEEPKKEESKLVTMTQEDFSKIQKAIGEFADLKNKYEKLEYAADKSRLQRWDSVHKIESYKRAALREIGGKIVVAWKAADSIVERDSNTGRWTEKQTTIVHFEDGSTVELPILKFELSSIKKWGDVIKDTIDQVSGERFLSIKLDGTDKVIETSVTFIN